MRRSAFSAKKRAVQRGLAIALSSPLASTGSFTVSDINEIFTTGASNLQAWVDTRASPWLLDGTDLFPLVASTVARTVQSSGSTASPIVENRFYIKRCSVSVIIRNMRQNDVEIVCYPWKTRYDSLVLTDGGSAGLYANATTDLTEVAGSGTRAINVGRMGYTPFQSRGITEQVVLGKPRKVYLQGGQQYVFKQSIKKPFYANYARLGQCATGSGQVSFRGYTRGMFFTARGALVQQNPSGTVVPNPGTVTIQTSTIKQFDWVSVPTPFRWYDNVQVDGSSSAESIIQPQTGAVNTTVTDA